MIKIAISTKNKEATFLDEIKAWCIENISPVVPRGQHNQKKRKLWNVKVDGWNKTINVYVRRPTDHTMVTLKWL